MADENVVKDEMASLGLTGELHTLRESLEQARARMREGDGEDEGVTSKMGALVARLCDSIARVEIAQQKLAALEGGSNRLRREVERILMEAG